MRRALLASVLLLGVPEALPSAGAARAQTGDATHGRLDGDLVLSAGIGGGVAFGDRSGRELTAATSLELRARVLDSGGLVLAGEWRPEGESRIVIAADLRPLFLVRFATNAALGDRYVDLLIDSIGIELGAAITPLGEGIGGALALGWGLDLPLFVPAQTHGAVLLRLGGRWVSARPTDPLGPAGGTDDVVVLAVLTVRGIASLGLGRWEPPRYEVRADGGGVTSLTH